jgi:hypothetical protein
MKPLGQRAENFCWMPSNSDNGNEDEEELNFITTVERTYNSGLHRNAKMMVSLAITFWLAAGNL